MWNGIEKIKLASEGTPPLTPGWIALIAAIVSIVSKEILYRYTVKVGKEINNAAVIANAWHHRSDALSSIGTLIGISGAIILGGDWAVLDPIAAVIVSVLILRVAVQLGLPSVNELLEKALPKDVEKEILDLIYLSPEIKSSHRLRTRKNWQ
jgi:cation diffusion facilitator family transporter